MFLDPIGRFFKTIGRAFYRLFKSKEAQEVLKIIMEKILPEAKPIVEKIRLIIGDPSNATVYQIYDLYKTFGYTIDSLVNDRKSKENAVRNLATELIKAALPDKYETPWINSAIELALSGIKVEEKK